MSPCYHRLGLEQPILLPQTKVIWMEDPEDLLFSKLVSRRHIMALAYELQLNRNLPFFFL